jgi:hypothetical protein
LPALTKKRFVAWYIKQFHISENTLNFKNRWPGFFNRSREVADWRFITDGLICFAADKGKICNVASFPGRIAAF